MIKKMFPAILTIALLIMGGFTLSNPVMSPSLAMAADKTEVID